MSGRSIFLGLLAGALLTGSSFSADAAVANSSLGNAAKDLSGITDVRWVCGPYRCAWIPKYRGRAVVYPQIRGRAAPRSPHCFYQRNLFGHWSLVCP
jgi:hypothetical protein